MLKCILTSLLFFVFFDTVSAQDRTQTDDKSKNAKEEGTPLQKKEKIPYPNKKRGTSIGLDITSFFVPIFDGDKVSFEANIRTNFKKRMFLVGSLGTEQVSFNDKSYQYDSNGAFVRVGVDYDIFIVDEPDNNDNILIGLRYGVAFQDHGSDLITITDDYWGSYNTSISNYGLSSHWLEVVFGLRTEVFNNFYMSWFIRIKGKIKSTNSSILEPYSIPGYGNGSNKVNLGFSYNLEYQIPWGNKK